MCSAAETLAFSASLRKAVWRLVDEPPLAVAQGLRNRFVAQERAARRFHMDRMAGLYRALA